MKNVFLIFSLFLFLSMSKESPKNVEIGLPAPSFELGGFNLEDLKGNFVVLEWYNDGCPFVRKHYDSQNMQKLQKKYTKKGIKWIKVVSSAPGKQGHLADKKSAQTKEREEGSFASEILLDHDGKIGQMYGAQTTPHMYIIDKKGLLVYQGAIDSIRSYDLSDIPRSKNYVALALDSLLEGRSPKISKTQAYGCSVKY